MDFVPYPELTAPDAPWVAPVIFAALALSIVGAVALAIDRNKWTVATGIVSLVGVLVAGVFVAVPVGWQLQYQKDKVQASADWTVAVADEVENAYGLRLTMAEFKALRFPTAEPDEDFAVYGSIPYTSEVGDAIVQETITLIWKDGELFLGTTDDSMIAPLESVVR